MTACSVEPEDAELPTAEEAFASFMQQAGELPDGRLVIDGDIVVDDEAEAREYFEAQLEYTGLELEHEDDDFRLSLQTIDGIDQFWAFPARMLLTYCVDTASFGTDAHAIVVALERATQSWSCATSWGTSSASGTSTSGSRARRRVRTRRAPAPASSRPTTRTR